MSTNAEDVYEIRGDVPDPTGTGQRGTTVGMDLTRTAVGHPRIRYRDRISTADVYECGDERFVHLYCPRCANALRITNKMKTIRFSVNPRNGGDIDIEEFRCTWDRCGLHVRVRNNLMIDM